MAIKIYTRSGDGGDTSLFGGRRVRKDELRVEVYGTVDELNSVLGLAACHTTDPEMSGILSGLQSELFTLGADLATPSERQENVGTIRVQRIPESSITKLEGLIDRLEAELEPLTRFVLPGGSSLAATLHVARTVCRRAERGCVTLASEEDINPAALQFLNRLSDLLFVLARYANYKLGVPDVVWNPG